MGALVPLIVLETKIGPIVWTFTPPTATANGHGIHLGDLLAAGPAMAAVLPRRRMRLDRRTGLRAPLSPNPGRRAGDRPPS